PLTTDARLFVEFVGTIGRSLGVAIANPSTGTNLITATLLDDAGNVAGSVSLSIDAEKQLARFVHELFPSSVIGSEFRGSLRLTSSVPFSVVGLRFSGLEFSSVTPSLTASVSGTPSRSLTAGTVADSPRAGVIGGSNAVVFSQF